MSNILPLQLDTAGNLIYKYVYIDIKNVSKLENSIKIFGLSFGFKIEAKKPKVIYSIKMSCYTELPARVLFFKNYRTHGIFLHFHLEMRMVQTGTKLVK